MSNSRSIRYHLSKPQASVVQDMSTVSIPSTSGVFKVQCVTHLAHRCDSKTSHSVLYQIVWCGLSLYLCSLVPQAIPTAIPFPSPVAEHRGSVSAEHGIGIQKPKYIYHSKSREAVEMMRRVKRIFDPKVQCGHMPVPPSSPFGCMALSVACC